MARPERRGSVKIVVPVKQVAVIDDEVELNEAGTGIDLDSVDSTLNEWDTFSVEAALQLRDASGGGEVITVTVGDARASEGLLTCLAMGADRAVRVWDDDLGQTDALGTARILVPVVEREDPDLILCGVQSSDWRSGATGAALAGLTGRPHVAVVTKIELDDTVLTVERELEGGLIEVVRIAPPALLTVQTGLNQPRYANFRARKLARQKQMETLSLGQLSIDQMAVQAIAGSRVSTLAPAESGSQAEMIVGDAHVVAERIVAVLKEKIGTTL